MDQEKVLTEEEMKKELDADPVARMLMRLPFCNDWVQYKGETFFAMINWDASKKANKPMIDMSYCATEASNEIVLFTCQYDKNKFSDSPLSLLSRNK